MSNVLMLKVFCVQFFVFRIFICPKFNKCLAFIETHFLGHQNKTVFLFTKKHSSTTGDNKKNFDFSLG
ncbi:Uncharacterised protein [Psychrobacter phenylpyruvicus]|uniref:Uncharacterized protein n=1 Tax=Psychrobacter phenylpyruvicus TaxID=29432 RepID=A0A379LJB1_9GAMM|nr:Uncharacterised protein [Psychrobacter phenylpyruvicus]